MKLVDQWRSLEADLPADWEEARLELTVELPTSQDRAAALLGPASPGRAGQALRVTVRRGGGGVGPEGIRRLLARVDEDRIAGVLRLLAAATREPAEPPVLVETMLPEGWDRLVDTLPADWSDLLCELRLRSSIDLERSALLCAPLNPTRPAGTAALRFRVARLIGYGASPGMARRCLERCAAEDIRGEVVVLRALADTRNVSTQGPVWRVAGTSV